MTPALNAATALAQHRVTQLATQLPVHRAFSWLHLHEPQLRAWQLHFLAIPAPPFAEHDRAAWFLERFTDLGLTNPHIDQAGNAIAELPSSSPAGALGPYLLLSAHLDTVFPAGTPTTPTEDGPRILCPGACDNGAGLTALLAIIAALRHAHITPPAPILFVANTGEEGEGNLRGMRHLFLDGPYSHRIAAALALEGSGTAATVTRALGSHRFRVTLNGPGGHSWVDSSAPNPISLIAQALSILAAHPAILDSKDDARTTLSPGQISGGTSINSIPQSASVSLDLRSTDSAQLTALTLDLHRAFEQLVAISNRQLTAYPPVTLHIEDIGHRPAAALAATSPLLHTLRAVDRHLGLRTEFRLGSTDANLPLSLGIPAAALAAGGLGHGIHTLGEWHDPTGREIALRRILLTLLDTAQSLV
jgi:tripeptide aminopeptidase